MSDRLKELSDRIEKFDKEIQQRKQAFFIEAIKFLFDENPTLQSFRWTQYTDYFNDGDTCHFHTHLDYGLYVNDKNEDDFYNVENKLKKFSNPAAWKENSLIKQQIEELKVEEKNLADAKQYNLAQKCQDKIARLEANYVADPTELEKIQTEYELYSNVRKTLNALSEDMYLSLFGDHCEIVVTKDKIEVKSYTNHD